MLATLAIAGVGILIAVIIVIILITALIRAPPMPNPNPPGPNPPPLVVADPQLTNTLISEFTLNTQATTVVAGRTSTEDIIFTGCPTSGSGRVDIYTRNLSSNVVSLVNTIYPPPGPISNFGFSIAVTPGAEYLIVGAPTSGMPPQTGSVFIYQRTSGFNYSLTSTTSSTTPTSSVSSRYGQSVAIKIEGSTVLALIGEPGAQDGDGMITVLRRMGGGWSLIKRFNSSDVGLETGSRVEFTDSGIVSSGSSSGWYFENYSQKYIYPDSFINDLAKVNKGVAVATPGGVNIYTPLSLTYSDPFNANTLSSSNSGLSLIATSPSASRYYRFNVNWSLVGALPGGIDSCVTGGGTTALCVYILTGTKLLIYS